MPNYGPNDTTNESQGKEQTMPVWRSMETAPKDGTWFWGRIDVDAICMRWHDEFDAFVSSWRQMQFAESYGGGSHNHSPVIRHPDFWMPLPEAPK